MVQIKHCASKKSESRLDNYLLIGALIISLCTLGVLVYKMIQKKKTEKKEGYSLRSSEGYGFFEDAGKALDQGLSKLGKATEGGLEKVKAEGEKLITKGKDWVEKQREKKEIEKLLKELQ